MGLFVAKLRNRLNDNCMLRVFFKENFRYPVWTCRDPISLILGTRIGSLKQLKNPGVLLNCHASVL